MNNLPDTFYAFPNYARTTMTRKELRVLLLSTDGKIITYGRLRSIKSKHIGAGVYEVTLEATNEK